MGSQGVKAQGLSCLKSSAEVPPSRLALISHHDRTVVERCPVRSNTPLAARDAAAKRAAGAHHSGVMSGRFEHFETQMMEQDDQNRIIDSQKGIREEMAKEEHLLFAKARDAATAPAPTVQIAKVPPKPRPKLPSFVQTAAVGKRPHSEVSPAPANRPQKQAVPKVSAPAASEVAPAKAEKPEEKPEEKPASLASLLAYDDSDDDDDEPAER